MHSTAAANRSTNLLDLIAIGSNGLSISTSTSGGSYGTFTKRVGGTIFVDGALVYNLWHESAAATLSCTR